MFIIEKDAISEITLSYNRNSSTTPVNFSHESQYDAELICIGLLLGRVM
jgi:hypothetical protein